VNTSLQGND